MTALNLILFFAFQVIAALLFKWSGSPSGHYWGGFVGGNLFGVTSIVMLINLYRVWPAGMVLGVATGGAFLLNQLAMFAVYRESLTLGGWCGIAMILAGILLVSFAK